MKKIFALALALVLALSMGSVAMAATVALQHGTHVLVDDTDADFEIVAAKAQIVLMPGETYKMDEVSANLGGAADDEGNNGATQPLHPDNYKLTYKITKGAALIESIKLKKDKADDGYIEIKTSENYTISEDKEILGSITLTEKGPANPNSYVLTLVAADPNDDDGADFGLVIRNHVRYVTGVKDVDDAEVINADNNTIYICEEDEGGYVKFNASALLGVTMKMKSEEKAFMYNLEDDEDIIDPLEEEYPEATIRAYSFGGQPTFSNPADFTLQADYSDQYYVYTYEKGKLTEQDYEWNSEDGVYEWSTKSPRTYVISDVELVAAAETEEETKNPDTCANDVVGVAAALAVVSLVAAGAVSLKK